MKRWILVVSLMSLAFNMLGQIPFSLVAYNVENAFDTRHDSLKNDMEFLPQGTRYWNLSRYWNKLNKIAKVIAAAGQDRLPDLVALCEVENDSVLQDLTRRSSLRAAGYRYVITSSPDQRGVDVALLYQPGMFRMIKSYGILIPSQTAGFLPTRHLLYAEGVVRTKDTLSIIVCHLPSKSGGSRAADSHRKLAARVLRSVADSVLRKRPLAKIILTGDYNAYPEESIFSAELRVAPTLDSISPDFLYRIKPVSLQGNKEIKGTYRYKDYWGFLDHILLSADLLNPSSSFRIQEKGCSILDFPFLLEKDAQYGGMRPLRTYRGFRYQGGYSDHLPLKIDFWMFVK